MILNFQINTVLLFLFFFYFKFINNSRQFISIENGCIKFFVWYYIAVWKSLPTTHQIEHNHEHNRCFSHNFCKIYPINRKLNSINQRIYINIIQNCIKLKNKNNCQHYLLLDEENKKDDDKE